MKTGNTSTTDVVGIVPAAGKATRLGELPFSKALYPVGFRRDASGAVLRPKLACEYLLDGLRTAGVHRTFVVVRAGRWDIPDYLGDGGAFEMQLAYISAPASPSAAHSVNLAYPFIHKSVVAFGFPDVLFRPPTMLRRLIEQQAHTNADVVLALAPAHPADKLDRVTVGADGSVRDVIVKSSDSNLPLKWVVAVWTPTFSRLMREFLLECGGTDSDAQEVFVGEVIRAAIVAGLRVESVLFSDGASIDIGTPEDLSRAVRAGDDF
ncbi:MAG: NTP transferase domain-containing protein [Acidobacteria bacterium]|nr:NTP transferase domain-containing protein [Acidobacteriota bacterium]